MKNEGSAKDDSEKAKSNDIKNSKKIFVKTEDLKLLKNISLYIIHDKYFAYIFLFFCKKAE